MSLSPAEAAESLKEIEKTSRRSAEAQEYAFSSPSFILWGMVWMAGYSGSYLLGGEPYPGAKIFWFWIALVMVGIVGSSLMHRRRYCDLTPDAVLKARAIAWRWGMTTLVFYAFIFSSFAVMRPANPVAAGAFVPLLIAAIYAVMGIWRGRRFLYAGIAVAALTLGGWFFLPHYFLLWMAAVGGGSLILVGLWLRKA